MSLPCLTQAAALGHLQSGGLGPAFRVIHHVEEHLSKPGGHDVVEDGVDGGAQVEADSRHHVDVLEDLEVLVGGGVHEAPHQAVDVEGSPAEAKCHHQHT